MSKNNKNFQFFPFVIALAIPLAIGAIGSVITRNSKDPWYDTINRPSFNPPDWVFAPVWTTLFVLMGIASYLVWKERKTAQNYSLAAAIYIIQLLLNLLWSFLFFSLHNLQMALIEICVFVVVLIINASIFYRINKVAGWLFIPYILWVSFATYLTYSIFKLN